MEATGELRSTPREHARLGTEPIDGLRGFAVLLVVLFHTWLFSWAELTVTVFGHQIAYSRFVRPGYLGVDIFFVVSAFCLAFPYVQAQLRGVRGPTVRDFALRRFLKIVPSYLIALAATIGVAAAEHMVRREDWWRTIWQHLLFVQNIDSDQLGGNNSVLWSLAVEIQFYLVFPIVIWFFLRSPLATTALMIGIALAHRNLQAHCCLYNEGVMRLLPAYLDLFGIGMFAAWLVVRIPARHPRLAKRKILLTLLGVAGGVALVSILGYLDDNEYTKDAAALFTIDGRTLTGLAIGLFAVGSCLGLRWWRAIVGNPVLTALSLVSYNVYLWHTLIELFFAHYRIPYVHAKEPHDDAQWRPAFIALSFATIASITTAITYFVERPLLGFIKPQSFAFPWRRIFERPALEVKPEPATSAGPG